MANRPCSRIQNEPNAPYIVSQFAAANWQFPLTVLILPVVAWLGKMTMGRLRRRGQLDSRAEIETTGHRTCPGRGPAPQPNDIDTEHILLGLIHQGQGVGASAPESLGISLEMSLAEASCLGHNYIGTEHEPLGLIHEGGGVAAQVLVQLGADLPRVRQRVIQLLSSYGEQEKALGVSPS